MQTTFRVILVLLLVFSYLFVLIPIGIELLNASSLIANILAPVMLVVDAAILYACLKVVLGPFYKE